MHAPNVGLRSPFGCLAVLLSLSVAAQNPCGVSVSAVANPQTAIVTGTATGGGGTCGPTIVAVQIQSAQWGELCAGGGPCTSNLFLNSECWAPGLQTSRPTRQSVQVFPHPNGQPGIWQINYNYTLQNMNVPAGVEWMFFDSQGNGDNLVHGSAVTTQSGTFPTSVDTQCWRSGTYTVRFNQSPCHVNSPTPKWHDKC